MPKHERTKLFANSFKFKSDYLTPKLLMASDNILPSQMDALQSDMDQQTLKYVESLGQCMSKEGQRRAVCLMKIDCAEELGALSLCVMKNQKSMFLCKLPKLNYISC